MRSRPSVVVLPLTPAFTTRQLQAGGVQILLQKIGKAFARIGAEPGRQTIAERHDHRARIYVV